MSGPSRGVSKVTAVEIKDVGIPITMQRGDGPAGRGGARATRQDHPRRGQAPGPGEASRAAAILNQTPAATQLRYLQTLSELGGERGSTILFPSPVLIRSLLERTASAPAGDDDPAALDPGPRDDALAGMLQAGLSRRDSTPG